MNKIGPSNLRILSVSITGILVASVICALLIYDLRTQNIYAQSVHSNNAISEQQLIEENTSGLIAASVAIQKDAAMPVMRLEIPKIKVNSILEQVGLTPQGAVGVPKKPSNAAWFNASPRPGEIGSAIITGHYGRWKNGALGVFNNLYKLKIGDKIYLQDENRIRTTFVVRKIKIYDAKAEATDVFISSDGKAHLNLITCDGIWNKRSQSYSNRLVVFTEKLSE